MYLVEEELETQITKAKSIMLRDICKQNKSQCSALRWLQCVPPLTLWDGVRGIPQAEEGEKEIGQGERQGS